MLFNPPPIGTLPPLCCSLFISHAWTHNEEYEALVDLIKPDEQFRWENLSVPKSNPLETYMFLMRSYRYLVRQLDEEIKNADCFLVLAGMYAAHSGWIQSEIEAAKEFSVPIVAVEPRGNERFPEAATHAANERAGWNRSSIIAAIRRCARAPRSIGIAALTPPPSIGLKMK